jgi:hypothetical protein
MRPVVALAFLVCPGKGDDDAAATLLDGIDPPVVVAELAAPVDRPGESLTGLVGAVSGWGRPPESRRVPSAAPLHLRVDQRDERVDLTVGERLIGGTDRVDAHA